MHYLALADGRSRRPALRSKTGRTLFLLMILSFRILSIWRRYSIFLIFKSIIDTYLTICHSCTIEMRSPNSKDAIGIFHDARYSCSVLNALAGKVTGDNFINESFCDDRAGSARGRGFRVYRFGGRLPDGSAPADDGLRGPQSSRNGLPGHSGAVNFGADRPQQVGQCGLLPFYETC